jgi:hypothetical protein
MLPPPGRSSRNQDYSGRLWVPMRRLQDARHPPYTYLLQQAKATNRCQAAIDLFVLVGSGLVTRKGPPRQ